MNTNHAVTNEALDNFLNMETSFNDVLPEPIEVRWVEWVEEDTGRKKPDGKPVMRRKPEQRVSWINTYVPMNVLHHMMASQEKMKRMQGLQKEVQSGTISESSQQMMLGWMTEQVWNVWKLTEPDMTIEKLGEGLQFQQVFWLFRTFFGDLLAAMNKQRLS